MLLRLPGYSPMPAFGNVVDVPLVTRKARRCRAEVRAALGVDADTKLVLYQFGGQVNLPRPIYSAVYPRLFAWCTTTSARMESRPCGFVSGF